MIHTLNATLLDRLLPRILEAKITDADLVADLISDARAVGGRVLDLRGLDRTKHYPMRERCIVGGEDFGAWGWFNDKIKRRNIPKRGKARGVIPWRKLSAQLLHTTDCDMQPARLIGCPVQAGVALDTIVLCHPVNARMWHAHAANGFATGIEVVGRNGAVTDLQIELLGILMRYNDAIMSMHHARNRVLMAHRQSHWSRGGDPGPAIWRAGWQVAQDLSYTVGPVVGSGKSIPRGWM